MNELNPNHRVTAGLHDHWHKLLAVVLHKYRHDLPAAVVITEADVDAFVSSGIKNIAALDRRDGLHLRLVDDAEGARLARTEGGLPT